MREGLKITGIILMAGSGNRFGSALPKQFHQLAGKKIYQHTLEKFLQSELFDDLLLVCPHDKVEEVRKEVSEHPNICVLAGGETRQQSALNALLACQNSDIVCIHDAVRPFVTKEILENNIAQAIAFGAVNTCIPSTDTLAYAPNETTIDTIPLRSEYQRGQTPQTFRYPLILKAHLTAKEQGVLNRSDDCSLVLQLGQPVHITRGSEMNIKITTELDLCLADQILRLGQSTVSSSQQSIQGKHYIVTGGTGDIGQAICAVLEGEGAIPIPLSRSSPLFNADLTSFASAQAAFQSITNTYGPVDGLINSIGKLQISTLSELSEQDIEEQISANLKALIFCCKCALLKSGAHIVNIASSSYARGRRDFTIYSSAKAAVVNFTQGLAEERSDLHINAIVPQRTKSKMRLKNFTEEDPALLLTPQEVALEILSILKQNLTGSVIEVRKKLYRT